MKFIVEKSTIIEKEGNPNVGEFITTLRAIETHEILGDLKGLSYQIQTIKAPTIGASLDLDMNRFDVIERSWKNDRNEDVLSRVLRVKAA